MDSNIYWKAIQLITYLTNSLLLKMAIEIVSFPFEKWWFSIVMFNSDDDNDDVCLHSH